MRGKISSPLMVASPGIEPGSAPYKEAALTTELTRQKYPMASFPGIHKAINPIGSIPNVRAPEIDHKVSKPLLH